MGGGEGDVGKDGRREYRHVCWPHSQGLVPLQLYICQSGNETHIIPKLIALHAI